MYFAKDNNQDKTFIYVSLFKRLEEDEFSTSFNEVKIAILDAKSILEGEKDIFEVTNDQFNLISLLLSKGDDLLRNLDSNVVNKSTMREFAVKLESKL